MTYSLHTGFKPTPFVFVWVDLCWISKVRDSILLVGHGFLVGLVSWCLVVHFITVWQAMEYRVLRQDHYMYKTCLSKKGAFTAIVPQQMKYYSLMW